MTLELAELRARGGGSRDAATVGFFAGPRSLRGFSWATAADAYPHAAWLAHESLRRATLKSLTWPVASTWITSPFGWRYHPITGRVHLHRGIDIAVREGTQVHAAGSGVVRRVREDAVSGRWVQVDHGYGVFTLYCHNSEVLAKEGQRVSTGDVISLSGSTGISTGPHLHFQVQEDYTPIDLLALHDPAGGDENGT